MFHANWFPRSSSRSAGLLLVLAVSALGLTGCYTQLKTADTSNQHARAEQKPASAQQYADEYRREYRREARRRGETHETTTREYNYHFYDWSVTHSWSHYDPFFHEPFYHRPYGSQFSFSFRFGTPYVSVRPRYYRSFYLDPFGRPLYGYRYGTVSSVGPAYGLGYGSPYYVGTSEDVTGKRDYRPRGGTVGRGVSGTDRRDARSRNDRRAVATRRDESDGRIGRRSADQGEETRRSRSSRAERTQRARLERSNRPRSSRGRIGRRAVDRDRTARRRSSQNRSRSRTPRRSRRADDTEAQRSDRSTGRDASRQARRSSGSDGRRTRSGERSGHERSRSSRGDRSRFGETGDGLLLNRYTPNRLDTGRYEQQRKRLRRKQRASRRTLNWRHSQSETVRFSDRTDPFSFERSRSPNRSRSQSTSRSSRSSSRAESSRSDRSSSASRGTRSSRSDRGGSNREGSDRSSRNDEDDS
ncbi:hypothetical protein [Salinibacter altiplanensis]|uniref:hypothetical protein n=1 Tax=Salinibacter altiplanensis TaxID=1803181 RepID=UPI000C9FF52E|nr:hypothetical protein [Salinibacter altiplanensis]